MRVSSSYQLNGFPQSLSSWNYEVGLHHLRIFSFSCAGKRRLKKNPMSDKDSVWKGS